MLTSLTIKNVALIDNATINFSRGLNVLSGETGSGKSVILESLNFVLGAKADKTLIRSGTNECFVIAEFDISNNQVIRQMFEEFNFDVEDELIISRKLSIDGKNTIRINGNTATVGMLRKFTASLVDVHGQSEHFYLLKPENQLDLIDKFLGNDATQIKEEIKKAHQEYKQITLDLSNLGGEESVRLQRIDVLNFQINEISNFKLKKGEEEKLEEIKYRLINREKILYALNAIKSSISAENGASDLLKNAKKAFSQISHFHNDFNLLEDRLINAITEIEDISAVASDFFEIYSDSDYDADQIEERLDGIKELKRKYGGSIDSIISYLVKAQEEVSKLENFEELARKLLVDKSKIENLLYEKFFKLSCLRKATCEKFRKNVLNELQELGINKAQFNVDFNDFPSKEECNYNSTNGIDEIEFKFSANLGEPLKNLASVISGGEMSRFMLSIKTQTSKINNISTFVFDEIDTGISGVIAKIVAEKFAKIAKNTQIIAISHLPQISAMADVNLLISKTETGDKTITQVQNLNGDEKINEIIRLIGGDKSSSSAVLLAKELISNCNNFKQCLKT